MLEMTQEIIFNSKLADLFNFCFSSSVILSWSFSYSNSFPVTFSNDDVIKFSELPYKLVPDLFSFFDLKNREILKFGTIPLKIRFVTPINDDR